jgi:hypothetical protein
MYWVERVTYHIKKIYNMSKSKNEVMEFRNGIFLASSRTYGETIIEPIIRKLFGLNKPNSADCDSISKKGIRGEIKASKVLSSVKRKKNVSFIDRILLENNSSPINRLVSFKNRLNSEYLSNIQNVKRDHFDELIYVMLFEDCIKIFISDVNNINKKNLPNWCDKHGRYDKLGKSGQFGITKNNIEWHTKNNLKNTLSWEEAYEIAKTIK